jgi:hypothetical protein
MTEAYKQGYDAAKAGKDLLDNPYDFLDLKCEDWQDGFFDFIIADTNDCVMSA